jgi:hypothetical protein
LRHLIQLTAGAGIIRAGMTRLLAALLHLPLKRRKKVCAAHNKPAAGKQIRKGRFARNGMSRDFQAVPGAAAG